MERTHHTLEFVGPRQQTSPKIGRETLMRTGMRSIGIVVLVVTGGFLGSIIFESDVANAQTPHAPIYIDGNESFTAANGVTRGKGTPSDPFIIEGWEIAPSSSNGIEIRNTNVSFVIQDVYVHSVRSDYNGIYLLNVSNGRIEDNTISNNVGNGVLVDSSDNIALVDNSIFSNTKMGIRLSDTRNVTIAENDILNNHDGVYIYTYKLTNAIITSNDISNNSVGVRLFLVENVSITGNKVSSNWVGIFMGRLCTNVEISDNEIDSNKKKGISSKYVWNVTITDNYVSNSDLGIDIDDSKNFTITDNYVSNNSHGIYVYISERILVYHNSFINNTVQASDQWGIENSWDGGYPTGGNYWSDYLGWDSCSGPDQNSCSGSDGVGDNPYVIDEDTQDRYPMLPYGPTASPRFLSSPSSWLVSSSWLLSCWSFSTYSRNVRGAHHRCAKNMLVIMTFNFPIFFQSAYY